MVHVLNQIASFFILAIEIMLTFLSFFNKIKCNILCKLSGFCSSWDDSISITKFIKCFLWVKLYSIYWIIISFNRGNNHSVVLIFFVSDYFVKKTAAQFCCTDNQQGICPNYAYWLLLYLSIILDLSSLASLQII